MQPGPVEFQFVIRIGPAAVETLVVGYDLFDQGFPVDGKQRVDHHGNLVFCKVRRRHDCGMKDLIGFAFFCADDCQQK